jgi:hypothetical protein
MILVVLLLSGAPASMAMLAVHPDDDGIASQTISAADHRVTTPVSHYNCDHGLPCCIGSQCTMNAYWIPAKDIDLPSLSKFGVLGVPSHTHSLNGIATQPSSPPPRALN